MASQPAWKAACRAALRLARQRAGVIGVDYGYVYKGGERLKTLGVRFHVRDKVPLSDIPPLEVLPAKIGAVRCDVVEASYALASARQRSDPLEMGLSIGNLDRGTTGTLGLMVRDRHTAKAALLSNWHVLCGTPAAAAGDRLGQPGPQHLGSQPARLAGRLERWIALNVGLDAAIGLLDDAVQWRQALFGTQMGLAGVAMPSVGMKLVKYGATSGLTHAMVDGVGGSYEVDYSPYGDSQRWMEGVRLVQDADHVEPEISLAGDSGAVWVDAKQGYAVALHFAGEDGLGPTAEYALAQPLPRVLDLLDVDLL